jgi:hypothetical protein
VLCVVILAIPSFLHVVASYFFISAEKLPKLASHKTTANSPDDMNGGFLNQVRDHIALSHWTMFCGFWFVLHLCARQDTLEYMSTAKGFEVVASTKPLPFHQMTPKGVH